MGTKKMTNILLLLIFLLLLAMLATRSPIQEAGAETLRLDGCITTSPYDKPQSYLHVIMHDVAAIQSGEKLKNFD